MDSADILEQLLRLAAAAGAGMLIGMEREWREKAAGFRTVTLVSVGAALVALLAEYIPGAEQARLAAGAITGIGFLGAGVIMRERGEIVGITTAAAVWFAAALGLAAGVGAYSLTAAGALLGVVVLLVFPAFETRQIAKETRAYEVTLAEGTASDSVADALADHGLVSRRVSVRRSDETVSVIVRAVGKPTLHEAATRELLADARYREVSIT